MKNIYLCARKISLAICVLALCQMLSLNVFAADAHSQSGAESSKVIIVLDASGSMWGQIKNQAKITIAKDVVSGLVKDLDPETQLGLTVYGHRKKGDCSDIESVVPVSPVKQTSFSSVLNNITPKGKTPLSKAVMQAANELKYTEEKATVILVSDGIETCDFNPCDVATKLESEGVDFTTHVIGFDINEEEAKKQLTCLAENTGGKYLTASDAASLKSSLEEAVKEAAKSEPAVKFLAVHEPGGKPLENVSWNIYLADETGAKKGNSIEYGGGSTPNYKLSPGKYVAFVSASKGKAEASKTFEVPEKPEGLQTEEVVLAEEGKVKLVAVTEEGGKPLEGVSWSVKTQAQNDMQKGETVSYGGGNTPEYQLLPGTYTAHVESVRGKASAEKEITVTAGKKETIEVVLAEEGKVKLVAVNEKGGKPLSEVSWTIKAIPANDMDKGETVTYGGGNTPQYLLLPGKYKAIVQSTRGKAKTEQEIEVIAGKLNTIEVLMPQEGIIKLLAVNSPGGKAIDGVSWQVHTFVPEDSMQSSELVTYGGGTSPEYKLLPGEYNVEVRSLRGKATANQKVTVDPGKKKNVEVLIPAEGEIELVALEAPGASPLKSATWQLLTKVPEDSLQTSEVIHYGGGATPTYRLLPGTYVAKLKVRNSDIELEKDVTVVAGKRVTEQIIITDEGAEESNG